MISTYISADFSHHGQKAHPAIQINGSNSIAESKLPLPKIEQQSLSQTAPFGHCPFT
jgi:hypothetical protein